MRFQPSRDQVLWPQASFLQGSHDYSKSLFVGSDRLLGTCAQVLKGSLLPGGTSHAATSRTLGALGDHGFAHTDRGAAWHETSRAAPLMASRATTRHRQEGHEEKTRRVRESGEWLCWQSSPSARLDSNRLAKRVSPTNASTALSAFQFSLIRPVPQKDVQREYDARNRRLVEYLGRWSQGSVSRSARAFIKAGSLADLPLARGGDSRRTFSQKTEASWPTWRVLLPAFSSRLAGSNARPRPACHCSQPVAALTSRAVCK
jgi:hypothetical protein